MYPWLAATISRLFVWWRNVRAAAALPFGCIVVRALCAALLAIAVLVPNTARAQNLIVNGGFETNDFTGWTPNGFIDIYSTGQFGMTLFGSYFANPYLATGSVSQNVSLPKAGTYALSFYYAAQAGDSWLFFAKVNGSTVFSTTTSSSANQQAIVRLSLAAGLATIEVGGTNISSGGFPEAGIDDVTLTFVGANALSPSLPANAPDNVKNVAGAIDQFVAGGGTLPAGFSNLTSLTGDALVAALQQLTGEAGATGGQQGGTQLTNSFLTLLLNGFTGGRGAAGGFGAAMGYAGAPSVSPEAANAYAAINKAAPSHRLSGSNWTMWGSAYGGQSTARGDALVGTNDTRATTWGLATGFDRRLDPSTVVGFAFAGGSTNWSLANGAGAGRGEVFQTGVYASHQIGAAYLAAAATYAYHRMTTDRTVMVAGTDNLTAGFDAHNVGARIEAGRRFAGPGTAGITPYAAAQVQAFFLPSYNESATSGSNQFALAFGSRTATTTRSELGFWFDTRAAAGDGTVTLFSRLAWAHDWRSDDTVTASFQSLSGSSFIVNGATPPENLGLVTAGVEAKATSRVTVTAKFDGEFANGYQSYAGTGTVRYAW
jgi:uncharacterized protein with beta-barrel porin domain